MPTLAHPIVLALKAALAVALALAAVRLAGLTDALSATFAALVCTSPVVVTGMRRGVEQLVASLIGGAVTTLLLEVLPREPLALGLAMAATVLLSFRVGFGGAYLVAGFTVLYVHILPADSPGLALEQRLLSLLVGVIAATLVNSAASAGFYRQVFARRVRIVRGEVARAAAELAAAARPGGNPAAAPQIFDRVFPILWALGSELGDAGHEGVFRRSVTEKVDAFRDEVRGLALFAHLAKGLSLHLAESPALAEVMAPALESLHAELVGTGRALDVDSEAEWARTYRRAIRAIREGR